MKILLAEDERRMAEALLELLRQEGYDVDWFANGIEALLAAQANVYDALILDVMLPGSDGFAITSTLRREGISTPILMLTARGELEDKVQGLDSGPTTTSPNRFSPKSCSRACGPSCAAVAA